jgi:ribosomal protein S8
LLKYKNQKPAITRAIRISKPSKRVYVSVDLLRAKQHVPEGGKAGAVGPQLVPAVAPATTKMQGNISPGGKTLPRAQGLLGDKHDLSQFSFMQGTFIISTSKGPVPDATAVDLNLGGELLCHVYQQLRPLVAIALRSLRPASPGAAKQAFDPCPRFAGALAHGRV